MRFASFGVTEYKREQAFHGVTLFTPLIQNVTYLIGMNGEVFHKWTLEGQPGNYTYLLPNGNLLAAVKPADSPYEFSAMCGKIQEISWD